MPQQQAFDRSLPIRGRDLVRFGVDGHHWGLPRRARAIRERVDEALEAVGASAYADAPVGLLSGGEQQRLRIAQALLGDLLISVTTFFRDSDAFAAIAKEVLPQFFPDKDREETIRVWVPGCATGEEAYSFAILRAVDS